MKQIALLALLVILFSCTKKESKEIETIDLSQNIVIPKNYVINKTSETIQMDGLANETSWQNAKFTDSFIDIEGEKIPKFDTKVKMLWDDNFLYVYGLLEEIHIWADIKKRDEIIYFNNDFEVFIDPSGTGTAYGEIELNALNTVWDLLLTKPYRVGAKAVFNWNLNNLQTAVHRNGTLNNPKDEDKYWSVEMAIPLEALLELRGRPKQGIQEGDQWRMNFSRVEWDFDLIDGMYKRKKENDKYLPEYNWVWSPQKVINMHEPEKWGYIQFTNEKSSNQVDFEVDIDLVVKQALFALFRETRYASLKDLMQKDAGYMQNLNVKISNSLEVKANFYKTNMGFEFKMISPFTNKTILINEEGLLKIN